MLIQVELPEKYKTGHDNIDSHHAHLFNILYTIVNIMKNKDKYSIKQIDEEIYRLFVELHNYTQNHFKYEERIMEKLNYPDLDNHKELHKGFIKKILDIQKYTAKDGKISLINETIMFLRDWYLEHIFVEDKKIIAHQKTIEKKAAE